MNPEMNKILDVVRSHGNRELPLAEVVARTGIDPKNFVEHMNILHQAGRIDVSDPQAIEKMAWYVATAEVFSSPAASLNERRDALFSYARRPESGIHAVIVAKTAHT